MVEKISPILPLMDIDEIGLEEKGASGTFFTGNIFQDVLNKAIEGLNEVSASEMKADALMQGFMDGKVELDDVLIASAEMNLMVQLAVTTLTTTVNTFKEITQMPV